MFSRYYLRLSLTKLFLWRNSGHVAIWHTAAPQMILIWGYSIEIQRRSHYYTVSFWYQWPGILDTESFAVAIHIAEQYIAINEKYRQITGRHPLSNHSGSLSSLTDSDLIIWYTHIIYALVHNSEFSGKSIAHVYHFMIHLSFYAKYEPYADGMNIKCPPVRTAPQKFFD